MTDGVEPINAFASALVGQGLNPALANGYAKAFRVADTPDRQEKVIENLNLSHPMIGLALYGDAVHEHEEK
jgi:hypothetical protein